MTIVTFNINVITIWTRVGMLTDFIRKHAFDILLIQEVSSTESLNVSSYETYLNIGSSMRGTAIMAGREVRLTNVIKLPSGRAIAADYKGIQLINIYAPSGTARKTEREHFYNTELPQTLQAGHKDLLIGGDFNCVLHSADTTGQFQTSRALTELAPGLTLQDAWNLEPLPTNIHILILQWSLQT
jgi:exonuclease III